MAEEKIPVSIKVYDDKYEFHMENHSLKCKRYGEPWRGFIGDGAILQLFLHAIEQREQLKKLTERLEDAQKIITEFMVVAKGITG